MPKPTTRLKAKILILDVIVCGDEVKNGKPAPDLMLKACEKLKVDPKDTISVGDTDLDIIACKKAGCYAVGFKIDGDKKIDNLKELLEMI